MLVQTTVLNVRTGLGGRPGGWCGRCVSGAIVSILVSAGCRREFIPGPIIRSHCNTERLPFLRQVCAVFVFEFRELGGVGVSMTLDLRGSTRAPTRGAPTLRYEGGTRLLHALWLDSG